MQQRMWGIAATGVAAAGLCAVLATTALASPGDTVKPKAVAHAQAAVKKSAPSTKPSHGTASWVSEENRQLLKIQREIKVTGFGPTAAQVARADTLVGRLKAKGKATAAQLAWLALTPAQKRVEAAPVSIN